MNARKFLWPAGTCDILNEQSVSGTVLECLIDFMRDDKVNRFDYRRSDPYEKGLGNYPWIYIVKRNSKFTIWGYDFSYEKITFEELCDIVALTFEEL